MNLNRLSQSMNKIKPKPAKKSHARVSCRCHGQSNTTIYLQWPIYLSRTQTKVHNSRCPYSKTEDTVSDLNIRFSMCSVALRRKAQIALAISRGAGISSLSPALKTFRVVDRKSPAFRLVASFERRIGPDPSPSAWEKPAQALYMLFETRAASPHDRLPDGQTLLHVSSEAVLLEEDLIGQPDVGMLTEAL
jgi:hypothetical protein